MSNADANNLVLPVGCGLSLFITVLFVLLCSRIKEIKALLIVAYDLEEISVFGGTSTFRKRKPQSQIDQKHNSEKPPSGFIP